jgi:hypothetical protein
VSTAVQIIFVPMPVAGSSFPRVIGQRYPSKGKTPTGWPPPSHQPIPTQETRRMLEMARRDLAEAKARRLLQELEHVP